MFDYENDVYFCICGKKIDEKGTCGEAECIENFESFQEEVDEFYALMEQEGLWEGFEKFQTLAPKKQIGIFFELEDELMLIFLQGLGQKKVLDLVQYKSDAFRYRFLELIDPLLDESLVDEFKQIKDLTKEELKEFLLQIIDLMLQTVEKKE